MNSRWVMEEADEALKRNALIPVPLDAVDPPLGFRSIQAADLTGLRRRQPSQQLDEFVNAVHHRLQNAPMRPHGEAPHKASKVADADEITNATQPSTQTAKLQRSWRTSPAFWISIAAVMTGIIVFAIVLRDHDPPKPASTQQERIGASDSTVIFRDGSQKSLDEIGLDPGTKI